MYEGNRRFRVKSDFKCSSRKKTETKRVINDLLRVYNHCR